MVDIYRLLFIDPNCKFFRVQFFVVFKRIEEVDRVSEVTLFYVCIKNQRVFLH